MCFSFGDVLCSLNILYECIKVQANKYQYAIIVMNSNSTIAWFCNCAFSDGVAIKIFIGSDITKSIAVIIMLITNGIFAAAPIFPKYPKTILNRKNISVIYAFSFVMLKNFCCI